MAKVSLFRKSDEEAEHVAVPTNTAAVSPVEWYSSEDEGKLSVDVYQTKEALVIRSTIAGVKASELDITLNNDVITIRGKRYQDAIVPAEDYFYQECYWGSFSRSIVLPVEVKSEQVEASLKNGVLVIVLPKAIKAKPVAVKVAEDDEA